MYDLPELFFRMFQPDSCHMIPVLPQIQID